MGLSRFNVAMASANRKTVIRFDRPQGEQRLDFRYSWKATDALSVNALVVLGIASHNPN